LPPIRMVAPSSTISQLVTAANRCLDRLVTLAAILNVAMPVERERDPVVLTDDLEVPVTGRRRVGRSGAVYWRRATKERLLAAEGRFTASSAGVLTPRQGEIMAVGPVDVYIIGFPGNKFSGRIAPAIMELVEDGTIRVLDLLFVMKDAEGVVTTLEAADIGEEGAAFVSIDVAKPGALGPEDAEEVSDDLPSNSSALLIAFENLWVGKVVDALRAADAVLIDSIRIPVDVVEAVEAS
jgi:hypothetical protein